MYVDPRLNQIDDCLYRVATKAIIMQDDKVLLVQETPELWWGFPGGGIDHGETAESALFREITEELGVPAAHITSDLAVVHYTVGTVVHDIPRMNLFFRVSVPPELVKSTSHVVNWGWFTRDEFLELTVSSSYNRAKLARLIFGD